MNQIFTRLDNMNARVLLNRAPVKYDWQNDEAWTCTIELEHEGTELSSRKGGLTAEDALSAAFTAFMKVADAGLPLALISAPIEHIPPVLEPLDDAIPF